MALCRSPWITLQGDIAPCHKCPECLTNRKQLWTNRNILESYFHEKKSFVTLTYEDQYLPKNELGNNTLDKTHLQTFFRNLRSRTETPIRYYAVGEYGTSGERGINPHYHVLLYGLDQEDEAIIADSWRLPAGRGKKGPLAGFTYVGDVTEKSIAYVAGYVQKKTQYNKDMYEQFEIIPEYSTMSSKPTIGASSIPKFVNLFTKYPEYLTEYGDVPYSVYHGDRSLPLGEYLREKIREGCDLPHDVEVWMDEQTGELTEKKIWHGKQEAKAQRAKEMQILQENKKVYDPKLPEGAQVSIKQYYAYKNEQSAKQFDARQRFVHNSHTL
jgi:hypothetical protein